MKKWIFGLIVVLMAIWTPVFGEEIFKSQTSNTGIIGGQANEYWRQGNFGRLLLPERAVGDITGNPPANFGWLYVKDLAGASALYFENDAGVVVNVAGGSATAWDDIGNPDAAKTITFLAYTTLFTGAATAADQWTFRGTGNFGDVSVVKIESMTGNPTDGTVLEVVSHDTDADALLVTANSINSIQVAGSGNVNLLGGTGTVTYTDWAFTADGLLTITPDLGGTGITITPSAGLTTGLDVSNVNITNGVNLGATKLLGTTAVIDFTNFDVNAAGAITAVDLTLSGSLNAGTIKQDALVPATAAPKTITLDGAGTGGVTIGGTSTGTITLGGGSILVSLPVATDLTLAGGVISLTDTANSNAVAITNNTMTTASALVITANAVTSGKVISVTADGLDTGSMLYLDSDGIPASTYYIQLYDGAANDMLIGANGVTVITGAAGAPALTLTAGDLRMDNGLLDIDTTDATYLSHIKMTTNTDVAADGALFTLEATDSNAANSHYLLRLRYTADGDAQDIFMVMEDNNGDDKVVFGAGGDTTFTLDAGANLKIDAATATSTVTEGVIFVDFKTATTVSEAIAINVVSETVGAGNSVAGIEITLDDDTGAAGSIYGVYVGASDLTGSSEVIGYFSLGLDVDFYSSKSAAGTAIKVDANTIDSTTTTGDILLDVGTVTNGNIGQLIDYNVGDTGGGVTATAMKIDIDDDTASNAATINGLWINASDTTGHASTTIRGIYIAGAGLEAAIQVDTGYVRIGTGSSPDVTPGDDDLYVEGTIEVDGAARFDGAVTINNTLSAQRHVVTNDIDGKNLTTAESGTIQTNLGAVGGGVWNLPEASTAIGMFFTFVVAAAQNMDVNPADGVDFIRGLTNAAGDAIRSATVGDTVTLAAVGDDMWIVVSSYGTWADVN